MNARGVGLLLGGGLLGFALALGWTGRVLQSESVRAEQESKAAVSEPAACAQCEEQEARWAAEREELQLEVLRLTGELENVLADRIAREQEFLSFAELMTSIVPPEAPPELLQALGAPGPSVALEDPLVSAARKRLKKRSDKIFRELRALMVTEAVDSLDLLDAGTLGDGFIGPVVFRQLDLGGRPIGTLSADRLRLEGSRSGRTLTIVLEDGYERRDGNRFPFEGSQSGEERGGVRRIFLPRTDPSSWFDSMPELFGEGMQDSFNDDGRWEGFLVHRKLNELLARDASLGYYRVSALGGVLEGQLRGVELEQLDGDGRLMKRLLADRMTISLEPRGVLLLLQDGIQMQGARKFAFLDGRFRIFLPGSSQDDWTAAGLPGLVEAKDSPLGSTANRR